MGWAFAFPETAYGAKDYEALLDFEKGYPK